MKTLLITLSLCTLVPIITAISASAQTVTLVWDQNTEPEVAGYNIYYRTDTPVFPFNGVSLSEGTSPIFIDGSVNTSLTIDLPDDGNIYYFTATAVNDTGIESSVSNIVASEWIPYLIEPSNNSVLDTSTVTFMWDLPPESYNVSFDLYYGTDKNLNSNAMSVTGHGMPNSNWPHFGLSITLLIAILLPTLMAARFGRVKHIWCPVRIGFCIGVFVLQASCGGGGGGSGEDSGVLVGTDIPGTSVPSITEPAPTEPLFIDVITDIRDTQYQLTDLKPDTQYYWKVVATDNWGNPYESLTKTFRTPKN